MSSTICPMSRVVAVSLMMAGAAHGQKPGKLSALAAPQNVQVMMTGDGTGLFVSWWLVGGAEYYLINQRLIGSTAVTQLGQQVQIPQLAVFGYPYYPPPTAGTPFEYQVVAVSKNLKAPSIWVPFTVPAPPTAVLAIAPITTSGATALVTYAGPATLIAQPQGLWEGVGQCALRWSVVSNAVKYRVMRSSTSETERLVAELSAAAQFPDPAYFYHTDNVNASYAYGYRVVAVLGNGATTQPSPAAGCKSP